jgi:YihY family inner membrane protein
LDQPYRDAAPATRRGRFRRAASACYPTIRYWAQTEVHVHAFSISANILLSFFPFLIVMVSLCQNVFHWRAASEAVYFAVADYFPDQIGAFIERNLRATVASRGPIQIVSILLLLFTANGVFEPMEVALNRIWGCPENRSYLRNQIVSLGLIFACGALAMVSTMFTALNNEMLVKAFGSNGMMFGVLGHVAFKIAAIPISILALFLIYWILPNCEVRARDILPAAVGVGILLEVLKYVNLLTWPWFRVKLQHEYGPFQYSVATVLWGFLASMLILGGAEWAVRGKIRRNASDIYLN